MSDTLIHDNPHTNVSVRINIIPFVYKVHIHIIMKTFPHFKTGGTNQYKQGNLGNFVQTRDKKSSEMVSDYTHKQKICYKMKNGKH